MTTRRLETASTLASNYYTDASELDREIGAVFGRTWQLVGRTDQLPDKGSSFTATVGSEPVIVCRDAAGELRAMSAVWRMAYAFPPMRKRINRMAGRTLMATFGGALRFFGVGGASLAPDVEKFLREAKFPYAIGYGLTETSPLIAGSNATNTRYRSTGPVLPEVQVRIEDPDPKSGIGEIVVQSPGLMSGYYRDAERTAEVVTSGGWFHTGDLGMFDKDGYLYICGRKKNFIIGPSGENIYPEVIESVINRSDVVLESLVLQDQGQLVARMFLDYEKLDAEFAEANLTETQVKERIQELLESIRRQTNEQVSCGGGFRSGGGGGGGGGGGRW